MAMKPQRKYKEKINIRSIRQVIRLFQIFFGAHQLHSRIQKRKSPNLQDEVHPKSFVSNFWGALHF